MSTKLRDYLDASAADYEEQLRRSEEFFGEQAEQMLRVYRELLVFGEAHWTEEGYDFVMFDELAALPMSMLEPGGAVARQPDPFREFELRRPVPPRLLTRLLVGGPPVRLDPCFWEEGSLRAPFALGSWPIEVKPIRH